MIRLLARLILNLLANAVGLVAASLLLDGFNIDTLSIVVVTVVFSLVTLFAGPLMLKIAIKNIPAMTGGIALVTTFVGLLITDVLLDGLSISGVSTWVLASLIVWLFSLIGSVVLPLILFKKTLEKARN